MKKNLFLYALLSISFLVVLSSSCQKQFSSNENPTGEEATTSLNFKFDPRSEVLPSSEIPADSRKRNYGGRSFRKSTCGSTLFSSYTGVNFYRYPNDTINLANKATGTNVAIAVNANLRPNRFSLYSSNGSTLIASTPWMGYATYSGPWGASINTSLTGTLTFTKGTDSIYILKVETSFPSTGGQEDAWDATISCN